MKKFTIFLLTFLLFVGLSNVYAQTPKDEDGGGGPSRTAVGLQSLTQSGLRCATEGSTSVLIQFNVVPDGTGFYDDLTDQTVYVSTDGVNFTPETPTTITGGSFFYTADVAGTMYFYGEVKENGVPLPPSDTVEITVIPKPEITFAPAPILGIVCDGGNVDLSFSVDWEFDEAFGVSFDYIWRVNGDSDGAGTDFYEEGGVGPYDHEYTGLEAGMYEFTVQVTPVSVGNTCRVSDTIYFEVVEHPDALLTPDVTAICETGEVNLTASTTFTNDQDFKVTYTLFLNDEPFDDFTTPFVTGGDAVSPHIFSVDGDELLYGNNQFDLEVTITNANEMESYCLGELLDPVEVYVWRLPIPADAGADQEECFNSNDGIFDIEANTLPPPFPAAGVSSTGVWSVLLMGDGATIADPTHIITTVTVAAGDTAYLAWTITNGPLCPPSVDTVRIVSLENPTVTINGGSDAFVCKDGVLIIESDVTYYNSPGYPSYEYTWSGIAGDMDEDDNDIFHVNTTTPGSGTLELEVEDANGCTGNDDIRVTIYPNPTIDVDLESPLDVCEDDPVTITATADGGAGTPYTYFWSSMGTIGGYQTDNEYELVTHAPGDTLYDTASVYAVDLFGCHSDTVEIDITLWQKPIIQDAGDDQTECAVPGVDFTFTMDAEFLLDFGTATWSWDNATYDDVDVSDIHDPNATVTGIAPGESIQFEWTIHNGDVCPDEVSLVTLTLRDVPVVTFVPQPGPDGYKLCEDDPDYQVQAMATADGNTYPGSFTFTWTPTSPINGYAAGSDDQYFYIYTYAPHIGEGKLTVEVEDKEGCITQKTVDVAVNPTPTITIDPIGTPVCNFSNVHLGATVTATLDTQSYRWVMRTYDITDTQIPGDIIIGLDELDGTYRLDLPDNVKYIEFWLEVNTRGFNCPSWGFSNKVEVLPNIHVLPVGAPEDTVCVGGSTEIVFEVSNYEIDEPLYYIWLENNIYYKNGEVMMLPTGDNRIHMVTDPATHENEEGPESYCYSLMVWQGDPEPFVPECRSYSDCFMLTVLKDPVVTISGPSQVYLGAPAQTFTANVVGGDGNVSYVWYLNGEEVGENENTYTLDDPAILTHVDDYDIAVKVIQETSGCESDLEVHPFSVYYPDIQIYIDALDEACACSGITLTAVVLGDFPEYTLQWKYDGTPIPGATGHTYDFAVPCDAVDLLEFVVELSFGTCTVITAPIKYIQIIPKTVVWVDDYVICEEGMVDVVVNSASWGDGEIYRFMWYDGDNLPIDTTYEPHRYFIWGQFGFDHTGLATYKVKAEMLNAACESDTAEFHITIQGSLTPVTITQSATVVCTETESMVLFSIIRDTNIELYGTPTYTWWVDGIEVPGEALPYLNYSFDVSGIHYIYARLVYPGNSCELITDQVTIQVTAPPTLTIEGPTVICEDYEGDLNLYAFANPWEGEYTPTYQWYINTAPGATDWVQPIVQIPDPLAYIYEVEVTYGPCSVWATHYVQVNPTPTVSITASATKVCYGEEIILTAHIDESPYEVTYEWYEVLAGGTDALVGGGLTYTATTSGTYYFVATHNTTAGCVATSTPITITVGEPLDPPTVTIDPTAICAGTQVTVTGSNDDPNVNYKWFRNGEEIQGETLRIITETLTDPGTYTYKAKITDFIGCESLETPQGAVVTVTAPPTVTIEGPTLICDNDYAGDLNLYAYANPWDGEYTATYQWYINTAPGATDWVQPIVQTQDPLTYIYEVEVTYGPCVVWSQYYVIVNPEPTVSITASATEVCNGGEATLTAHIGDSPYDVTYEWYQVVAGGADALVGGGVTHIVTTSGTYYFVATHNTTAGCVAVSNEITITIGEPLDPPTVTIDPTAICAGTQVTVTGSHNDPNVNYKWFRNGKEIPNETLSVITETLTDPGTYTYTAKITDAVGCESPLATTGAVVTVTAPPTVTIEGPTLICDNDYAGDLNLYAFANPWDGEYTATYQWYINTAPGATDWVQPIVQISDPLAYIYEVEVTYGPCVVWSQYYVIVNPEPTVSITASATEVCNGGEATLTAHIGDSPYDVTYEWYQVVAGGTDALVGGGVTHIVTTSGTYYFVATHNTTAGCVAVSNEITITVGAPLTPPTVTVAPTAICAGTQVTVTGSHADDPNVIYTWFRNGKEIPNETLSVITETLTDPGTYTYTAKITDAVGCESPLATTGAVVTVTAPPTVTIEGPTLICDNNYEGDLNLYAFANPWEGEYTATYQWYINTAPGATDWVQPIVQTSDPLAYIYEVEVTYGPCVVWSTPYYVVVNPTPTVSITTSTTDVCYGGETTLIAHIGDSPYDVTYEWYKVVEDDDDQLLDDGGITLIVTESGTYYFVATHNTTAGCVAISNQITVTVGVPLDPPTISIAPVPANICSGEQVTVTGTHAGDPDVIYTWFRNGIEITGETLSVITETLTDPGNYTYTAKITDVIGCESPVTPVGVKATVKNPPTVTIEGTSFVCSPTTNPPSLLAKVYPINAPVSYVWRIDGNVQLGEIGPSIPVVTAPARPNPYIYDVEITDTESGCNVRSDAHYVYVEQFPVIGITADKTEICAGETVKLEAFVEVLPNNNMTYKWYRKLSDGTLQALNPGGTDGPIKYVNPSTTTTYTFTATELGSNCVVTSNDVTVEVIPTPIIDIDPITKTICQYEQVEFSAGLLVPVNATYTWLINGDIVEGAVTHNFTYNFNETGTFVVEVMATSVIAGCPSAIALAGTITVKFAPSVTISGVTAVCDAVNPAPLQAVVTPWNATITYVWYENGDSIGAGPTQSVNTVPSPEPYIYVVVITDYQSGCQVVSEPHEVYVTQFDPIQITSDKDEICVGIKLDLNGNFDDDALKNMLWQWYGNNNGNGEELIGEGGSLQYWPAVGSWVFTLKGTQAVSGCTTTSNDITVIVNPIPEKPVLEVLDATICDGSMATVSGDVEGEYNWFINGVPYTGGAMQEISVPLYANENVSELTPYIFTATVTINNCMSDMSDPVYVKVHPAISVVIVGEDHVCTQAVGEEHLVLHALVTGDQAGVDYKYTWYYVQDNGTAVMLFQDINNADYAIIPNDLPVNDGVVPYYFYVVVEAVDYGCSTQSDPHKVLILPQFTVDIDASPTAICVNGEIEATAGVLPGEGDFVYNYTWYVNDVQSPKHTKTVTLSGDFTEGINTITCVVERSSLDGSWEGACHGSATIPITILTAPELFLTQKIAGELGLPGMCIGGEVEMWADIINFQGNTNNFTYKWERDGYLLPPTGDFCTDVLNVAKDSYHYRVKALYNDPSLGCESEWFDFDPVKVVNQPTLEIATKDYILSEVCVGATLEIITTLGIEDPNIQLGDVYNWNNTYEWPNFTNQIPPRVVEFNIPGMHHFQLKALFDNPTCYAEPSNWLDIDVKGRPTWTGFSIDPYVLEGACVGEIVEVCAYFADPITDGTNFGKVQWSYNIDGGNFIDILSGVNCAKHKIVEAGEYFFMATYVPSNSLSGCYMSPEEAAKGILGPMEMNAAPTAMFVNEGVPTSCLSNPLGDPVELYIEFTGAAPFYFTIRDDKGTVWNLVSPTNFYTFVVKPTVTTKYTIESLSDFNKCDNSLFVKDEITVVVTDVEILTPFVASCDGVVNIDVLLNSYSIAEATIQFDCITIVAPIVGNVTHGTITFDMPACVPWGPNVAVVTIDNCEYNVGIMNFNGNGGVKELIYIRWEGNADVLAVSNNSDPASPYYNGGMEFLTYQWYKNGVKIEGATLQYYQHFGEPGIYHVHITGYKVDAKGNRLEYVEFVTCGFEVKANSSITVYPVPAQVDQPVWIDLNLTPAELDGAYLDIYDVKGAFVKHVNVESAKVKVEGFNTQGAYFGKITTGTNEIKSVKFVIVK